jgi:uncharacterized protein YijF (DUF1287 family)
MAYVRRTLAAVAILATCAALAFTAVRHSTMHPRLDLMKPAAAADKLTPFQRAVLGDLNRQTSAGIVYQDGYYSGGDPPPGIGVCTDVVVRSYRAAGIDLHKQVAVDIARHKTAYHIAKPDPNIDYRRCRNLAVFFKRNAIELPTSGPNADWEPGDIVLADTRGDGVPGHIGVVGNHRDVLGLPTVVHHLPGQFVAETDWLYTTPVLYHFRWPSR